MHGLEAVGYWLYAGGTALLAVVAGWTYLEFRLGARRAQDSIVRLSERGRR